MLMYHLLAIYVKNFIELSIYISQFHHFLCWFRILCLEYKLGHFDFSILIVFDYELEGFFTSKAFL